MNAYSTLETALELVQRHWFSAVFLGLTLVTLLAISVVRWWMRCRFRRLFEEQFEEENELDALPPLSPQDREAIELIRKFRREVWNLPEVELQLGVESLNQRAMMIIRSISAVYHPEAKVPQFEASLIESLHLVRRISSRLSRLAGTTPFNYLGNRRLSDYQRYYQVYRLLNENPLLRALRKYPYLSRMARWAMNLKNLGNPLYWAGKELSREGYFFLLRWFYITFTSQVGKEAMRLYSGRRFLTEEDRDAALVCHRLFALARQWGGPSPEEWAMLVGFVAGHRALEAETKVHILSAWAKDRLPGDPAKQPLQTKTGQRWYLEGLKSLESSESKPSPAKKMLIEQERSKVEKHPFEAASNR